MFFYSDLFSTFIFAQMAKHYLFIPSGLLSGYNAYADFAAGDIVADTVIFTGAMGKSDDSLATLSTMFNNGKREEALMLFEQVKQQHPTLAKYLLVMQYLSAESQLDAVFTELEWLLHDEPVRDEAYYTDQIMVTGPLLNSILVAAIFNEQKRSACWEDARDVLRTDNAFGAANLLEENNYSFSIAAPYSLKVMPWQIASTIDNESTRYTGETLIESIKQKAPEAIIQVLS